MPLRMRITERDQLLKLEAWTIWKWSKENKSVDTKKEEQKEKKAIEKNNAQVGYLYCISLKDKREDTKWYLLFCL